MSFAQQMVERLEALLLENVGFTSVNVDGRSVSYADLTAQYEIWKNKADRENGKRPTFSRIRLD